MSWIAALSFGIGLGLAYFGALWWTVASMVRQPERAAWIPFSGLARLILLGLGLAVLGKQGAGNVLAGLGGILLSRWYLLRRLGGIRHGG